MKPKTRIKPCPQCREIRAFNKQGLCSVCGYFLTYSKPKSRRIINA